jgi:hypothetical protein
MTDRPTAVRGHMPFKNHRTCAEWLAPLSMRELRNASIINLYYRGHTCPEIAEAYAVSPQAIQYVLRSRGVRLRPQGTRGVGLVNLNLERN